MRSDIGVLTCVRELVVSRVAFEIERLAYVCSTVRDGTVPYGRVQYGLVRCGTVQYGVER